jgi:hypothetical protein
MAISKKRIALRSEFSGVVGHKPAVREGKRVIPPRHPECKRQTSTQFRRRHCSVDYPKAAWSGLRARRRRKAFISQHVVCRATYGHVNVTAKLEGYSYVRVWCPLVLSTGILEDHEIKDVCCSLMLHSVDSARNPPFVDVKPVNFPSLPSSVPLV